MKHFVIALCVVVAGLLSMTLWNIQGDASTVCLKTAPPTPTPTPAPTPDPNGIQLGDTIYSIADHPRFEPETRLVNLRNRAVSGKRLWDDLVVLNDGLVAGCEDRPPDSSHIYALAVGYLAAPARTTWRDCAVSMFDKWKDVTINTGTSPWSLVWEGQVVQSQPDYASQDFAELAFSYDFLHDALTETQRSNWINWTMTVMKPYTASHAYYHRTSSNCVPEPHNLCITKWWGEYLNALSCVGEDARCNADTVYNFDWYRDNALDWDKDDIDGWSAGCHTYSGSDYGRNRTIAYFVEMADAENSALGIDAWETWMDECPKFWIHSWLPEFTATGCPYTNNLCSYFDAEYYPGQITWNQGRSARTPLISIERNRTSDDSKRAQHWYETVHTPVTTPYAAPGRINPHPTWGGGKEYLAEYFLRYDQDGATLDYTGWDTTFVATGLGMVFSRDSWGSGDKFWMNSAAASWVGDHQTSGCNSFKVFKNGEYGVVENDKRYNAGLSGQTDDAAAYRNVIVPGDGLVSGAYTAGFPRYGGAATCTIPNYSYGATYAYWHENLDAGYHSTFPMTAVRRNFWHLKPITIGEASSAVNYVVVMDWMDPEDAMAVAEQIFVPKNSPTVSDPDVTFTLTNTKTMIRRIYGDAITAANVTDRSAISDCIQCGSGMAKVSISSGSAASHFLGFVVSMQATDGSLPTTTAINGATSTLTGVLIDDAAVARVVLGPAGTGTVTGDFTFDASPSTAAEYVIAGLTPGEKYDVSEDGGTYTMDEDEGGAMTVDAMGVLRWTD